MRGLRTAATPPTRGLLGAFLAATILCAGVRSCRDRPKARDLAPPARLISLPKSLGEIVATIEAPSAADAILDGKSNVRIERRRYGDVAVALSTVRAGVREHHPPAVCLRASGYEVMTRRETRDHGICVVELGLRHGQQREAFAYTYFDGHQTTCSLWRRVTNAAAARILGRNAPTWATLQVLAKTPVKARQSLLALMSVPKPHPKKPRR
ncbi:MAG: exosortase-associated EpsI family protein [Deltaproteobacteria bacterium]|nr:exosortase-associated EpsI family protein [Deltaproteobacteria bacterium]